MKMSRYVQSSIQGSIQGDGSVVLKELRKHGLSIMQISRLTGISKGVIEKIGR